MDESWNVFKQLKHVQLSKDTARRITITWTTSSTSSCFFFLFFLLTVHPEHKVVYILNITFPLCFSILHTGPLNYALSITCCLSPATRGAVPPDSPARQNSGHRNTDVCLVVDLRMRASPLPKPLQWRCDNWKSEFCEWKSGSQLLLHPED